MPIISEYPPLHEGGYSEKNSRGYPEVRI